MAMIDVSPTTPSSAPPLPPISSRADKREAIDSALRADPRRSDNAIGRMLGVDHKTVGARRKALGYSNSPDNSPANSPTGPTPTQYRSMLIEAGKDFDAKNPPERPEETVDRMIAEGMIGYATAGQGGADAGGTAKAEESEENEELTLLPPRREVTIQHDTEIGEWIIRQRNYPDEDGEIRLSDEDMHAFVDVLTDHLGYGRFP